MEKEKMKDEFNYPKEKSVFSKLKVKKRKRRKVKPSQPDYFSHKKVKRNLNRANKIQNKYAGII
jgi:hypothetical protein